MKSFEQLPELTVNATIEHIQGVLDLSKKLLAKNLAKMLGYKKAKALQKVTEEEYEAYIMEQAQTRRLEVIEFYNAILRFHNVLRKIGNVGIKGINKGFIEVIDILKPIIIPRVITLISAGVKAEEAFDMAFNEVKSGFEPDEDDSDGAAASESVA